MTPGLSPISKIHLLDEDDSIVKRITKVPIQCDKPFTKKIDDVLASVSKVGRKTSVISGLTFVYNSVLRGCIMGTTY